MSTSTDPISSLDEHNAIVVGNHLVQLYREAQRPIGTVVSTHHTLFFNVLHYELKNHVGRPLQFLLKRDRRTGSYLLAEQTGDTPQFYHVTALADLWLVAQSGQAKTFHFNMLRTILEKTAFFLGYHHFSACIKEAADDADGVLHQRFVDLLSHGKYSMYEPTEMGDDTRDCFLTILRGFVERHPFNRELLPPPEVYPVNWTGTELVQASVSRYQGAVPPLGARVGVRPPGLAPRPGARG